MLTNARSGMGRAAATDAHRRAFTLLELLVVVAVVALLTSMLLPALAQARRECRLVLCQLRLRHWGTAFEMYAGTNGGFWPHIDGLDRDNGPADKFGWVDVLPPLLGDRPWREHTLGDYPDEQSFFQCPAAELAPEAQYSYRPRTFGWFSYAMNSCLELDRNCWRPHDGLGWPMPSFLRTDLIVEPARVVLLFDQLLEPGLGYDGRAPYRSAGQHCGSYPKAFSARHARGRSVLGGSILFCDGHVEWRASVWKADWPADLEVPPRSDADWFPYPP